jgi:hypothetical protein
MNLKEAIFPYYYSDDKNSAVQKNPADKTSSETPVVKKKSFLSGKKSSAFLKTF